MSSERQSAAVFYGPQQAGTLLKTKDGYTFAYDRHYVQDPHARPISLGMPLTQEVYESPRLFSFFEGLLPEGWLLDITSRSLKINPNDTFNLLLHVGSDPIGAVSVVPLDATDA